MRSCAVTLSDMELFIFPELLYALVLANIMSPRVWELRKDDWFSGLERMKPYRRITRLKQFIMDHYVFNLDLDTWGLTTKEKETARFSSFIDTDTLARSNALFGYEGDKYYFDIDIRTGEAADRRAAQVEAVTATTFWNVRDKIGKKVKNPKELGLPDPANFDSWWPPKGYKPRMS